MSRPTLNTIRIVWSPYLDLDSFDKMPPRLRLARKSAAMGAIWCTFDEGEERDELLPCLTNDEVLFKAPREVAAITKLLST